MHSIKKLVEMLEYKRPSQSQHAKSFGKRFLEPVFGKPDAWGNYSLTIRDDNYGEPDVIFTAHYDTVHSKGGKQRVYIQDGFIHAHDSDCLGADCTTGIWLILGMIAHGVSGHYVIHSDEEVGCLGSKRYVDDNKDWLADYSACISFDRMGYDSVITYQNGQRCASDEFARSVAKILNMDMKPDDTGMFTDSAEYVNIVPECTNVSVGYFKQHTKSETQDFLFAQRLLDALVSADWGRLAIVRNPATAASDDYKDALDHLISFTDENLMFVSELLYDLGYSANDLQEMLDAYNEENYYVGR